MDLLTGSLILCSFFDHFPPSPYRVPIGIWLLADLPLKVSVHVISSCMIKLEFLSSYTAVDLLNKFIFCKKIPVCPYKIYLLC